ncbi:MAG: SRPBCC family protein [Candidatus Bathyarchaeota archaeon]|nr:SRPBCC family protein [Candidatus Bathyarchaeota archaeon]
MVKSIDIEASPGEVFNFLIDFEKMNKAHEGFTKAEYTSKGPVGLGTTAHFVGKHGGTETHWDMAITEWVENQKIVWSTAPDSKQKLINVYSIEPVGEGVRLSHGGEYELPYSVFGKIVDKLSVSKEVDKEVTLELEYIKKAVEYGQEMEYTVNI